MNGIKQLREKLGFSQEHFAIYLDIERGLLSMVEIGKRELPAAALMKLSSLEQHISQKTLPNNDNLVLSEQQHQKNGLENFLKQHQELVQQKVKILQKKLKSIETNYNNAMQLLQFVRRQQQLIDPIKNKKDVLWLSVTEAMTLEKISNNNLVLQKKIQLEMDAIQQLALNIN